jgi:hypothetical protein
MYNILNCEYWGLRKDLHIKMTTIVFSWLEVRNIS